jgi:hypothetical protein
VSDELPKLFSDEEFDAQRELRERRELANHSAHDIRGEGRVRPERKPTDGLPESTIEQKFPHIAKKLTLMWASEACAVYISSLSVSDRPNRQGFPAEVMEDLMMLHEINEMLMKTPAPGQTTAALIARAEPVRREHD